MATDLERFVEAEGRAERVKDVRKKIDAEGVTYVYYQFASVTGRIMGKGVPAPHWETIAQKGFQLVYGSTANLFVDRHGNYIGYGPEAWELVGIPEPETFQVLPWDSRIARVWCTCFRNREDREGPGEVLTSDCRGNLRRIQEEFEGRTGMHLRAGMEPEMMWLKLGPDGAPSVEGVTKPYCYHIDQFSELQPIIHKNVEYRQKLRLDMIQADHEDTPSQIELHFGFDRAEQKAYNLSTFRQIAKQIGRELSIFPCFMPKPFISISANGLHTNMSLWRRGRQYIPYPDTMTRAFHEPRGASTSTTSPTAAPSNAEPSGESGETPPTAEISTSISSPPSSAISTIDPTPTFSSVSCSTVTAWLRRWRSVRIRASSRPCSFFAAWYSKFSERSPNSRAVLIACTAALRFGPSRSASSASRAAR